MEKEWERGERGFDGEVELLAVDLRWREWKAGGSGVVQKGLARWESGHRG